MMRKLVLSIGFLLVASQSAQAGYLDFTVDDNPDPFLGRSGSFRAGTDFFQQIDPQSTGTGVIDSFVRIQTNQDIVQGFNTDGTFQFDEKGGNFTHSLLLSSVPIVTLSDGFAYRQFLLDINQEGGDPFISLNELQIFIGTTGSPTAANTMADPLSLSNSSLIYDMDANENNTIDLNANLNSGSGSGDMFAYVRSNLFGTDDTKFVTLYSKFGNPNNNNDGFEEWAVLLPEGSDDPNPPVPEPASILLFGVGCIGLMAARRRKTDQTV